MEGFDIYGHQSLCRYYCNTNPDKSFKTFATYTNVLSHCRNKFLHNYDWQLGLPMGSFDYRNLGRSSVAER